MPSPPMSSGRVSRFYYWPFGCKFLLTSTPLLQLSSIWSKPAEGVCQMPWTPLGDNRQKNRRPHCYRKLIVVRRSVKRLCRFKSSLLLSSLWRSMQRFRSAGKEQLRRLALTGRFLSQSVKAVAPVRGSPYGKLPRTLDVRCAHNVPLSQWHISSSIKPRLCRTTV